MSCNGAKEWRTSVTVSRLNARSGGKVQMLVTFELRIDLGAIQSTGKNEIQTPIL